ISYWLCRSSQNCGRVPKKRPRGTAVSALIEGLPLRMSGILPGGTPGSKARRLALRFRAASSRFRRPPGWAKIGVFLTLVIVNNFHVMGIAVTELETDSPAPVDGHRPLFLPIAL